MYKIVKEHVKVPNGSLLEIVFGAAQYNNLAVPYRPVNKTEPMLQVEHALAVYLGNHNLLVTDKLATAAYLVQFDLLNDTTRPVPGSIVTFRQALYSDYGIFDKEDHAVGYIKKLEGEQHIFEGVHLSKMEGIVLHQNKQILLLGLKDTYSDLAKDTYSDLAKDSRDSAMSNSFEQSYGKQLTKRQLLEEYRENKFMFNEEYLAALEYARIYEIQVL